MATSQDFVNWVCSKELDPEFLKYLLIAEGERLLRFASGAVHQTIYFPEAKAFHICHPPVPEQRRIVDILNRVLESVAIARANAEVNCQNARELYAVSRRELWAAATASLRRQRLGTIAEVKSGGTPRITNPEYWGGNIPWYSSGELNNHTTEAPERSITAAGLENSNAKLFPKGSLLIGMYDTAALKMSILDREAAFNQAIAAVRPNSSIDLEFVLHSINVEKDTLLLQRRGVRQKNLSLEKIKDIAVPLPPVAVQGRLVRKLGSYSKESLQLESIYLRKLSALDELKRSLLHEAFSGLL